MKLLIKLSVFCSFAFLFGVLILVLAFFFPDIFGISIKPINFDAFEYFSAKGFFTSFSFYMLGYV
jgi:hypothetical protein